MAGDAGEWARAAREEVAAGMALEKCHACGCMHDGLARLEGVLAETGVDPEFLESVREWQDRLEPAEVDCRGCPHCYPAEVTNLALEGVDDASLFAAGPSGAGRIGGDDGCAGGDDRSGDVEGTPAEWPPVPGDYHAMCTGAECPVAVSTLGDGELADELAAAAPAELCIVGRTRTENTGVEKLLANVVANPTIQVLVLAGPDPEGHRSGETLTALLEAGVDDDMRVAGSPGRRPVLENATRADVRAFREQVGCVDLIGCTDVETIVETVVAEAESACTCGECLADPGPVTGPPRVEADPEEPVRMDPAGYFVVVPRPEAGTIVCEHYDYDHSRQRVVEGETAEDLYRELVERDAVTRLDHAAYLGAELARAELAVAEGLDYEQDGKPG